MRYEKDPPAERGKRYRIERRKRRAQQPKPQPQLAALRTMAESLASVASSLEIMGQ